MAQIQIDTVVGAVLQICRECPMPTIVEAYLEAARALCDHSRWLLKNVPGVTVADTALYTLDLAAAGDTFDEIIGIQAMSLTENATTIRALTEGFTGGWNPNPTVPPTDIPEFYAYVPEGQVALSRTPNAGYTFLANVVVQPKRGSVSVDSTLVGVWGSALDAGALAYLLGLPRTPWFDRVESRVQVDLFEGFKNGAASSAMRGFNAGAQTTDRYGRTSGSLRTRVLPI